MLDKPTAAFKATRFTAIQREALDAIDLAWKLRLIGVSTAVELSTLVKVGRLEEVYKRLR